jgi:Ras-related protein Rab-21
MKKNCKKFQIEIINEKLQRLEAADVRSAMEPNYKIVLLGDGRVGKSSLTLRFCQNKFSDTQESTVQASFLKRSVVIGEDRVNLAVWDTAGQERFHALGPIYYRDSNGAMLVYDTTDIDSFARVQHWVKELKSIVGDDIVLCIAGNKSDLEKLRQVQLSEAEAYAQSVGAHHFLTSAKTGKNVEEAFLDLAKRVHAARQANKQSQRRRTRVVAEEPKTQAPPPKKKSSCALL